MICENCKKEFDVVYGSGRFCCSKCARGFSTKAKRKEINEKVSLKLKKPDEFLTCPICQNSFLKKQNNQVCCSSTCGRIYGIQKCHIKSCKNFEKWSEIQKKSYKNGRLIVGGPVKWYQYKDFKVQGTYELRTCLILDKWVEDKKIASWEYTKDRIPYIGIDGNEHSYLIDFKVYRNDGSFYYIETKGYTVEKDFLKWKAVNDLGFELEVWYREDIKINEINNKV